MNADGKHRRLRRAHFHQLLNIVSAHTFCLLHLPSVPSIERGEPALKSIRPNVVNHYTSVAVRNSIGAVPHETCGGTQVLNAPLKVHRAALSLRTVRQHGIRCFSVVIADSDVRPLAHHSVRRERRKCNFVLIKLDLHRVISCDESAGEEGRSDSSHARKLQPLVIEPVVDLNDPEGLGFMLRNKPSYQRVQYFDKAGIIRSPCCYESFHLGNYRAQASADCRIRLLRSLRTTEPMVKE